MDTVLYDKVMNAIDDDLPVALAAAVTVREVAGHVFRCRQELGSGSNAISVQ